MTTIEQIVDIPADRHLRLDMPLPQSVPNGTVKIILNFMPAGESGLASKLDPELEKALGEAEQKRIYNQAHPEELKEAIEKLKEHGPMFGGVDGVTFQRKIRDEWEDRLVRISLSDITD
jgi:hypothetical protein